MADRWAMQFDEGYGVPERILALVRLGYLQDTSLKGDGLPSFGAELKDGTYLKLWVAHVDPGHPSREELPRFQIEIRVMKARDHEGTPIVELDDELQAANAVMDLIAAHGGVRRQLRLASRK